MKQMPIRLRLTLWYSVMFITAALLLSATSWWMLRRTIESTIHQDLQERIDDVRTQLQKFPPDASMGKLRADLETTYSYRDDGKWLQVMREDGSWIYRSRRMMLENVTLAVPSAMPSGALQIDFQQGGRTVRALSSRVLANGVSYSVETGMSMTKAQALLHQFGLCLLLMTPAVLLLAAVSGHFLSRKALLPVAAIAYEARRITDRNLDSRLPVLTTDDELSHLSSTLNHMLARIDASFRSVREFTANASHELRSPLTRIRTEAEVALFRPRSVGDYTRSLAQIHDDAVDMSKLIDELLTLARAEAGSDVLRMVPVDLDALLLEVANEWSGIVERLSIRFIVTGSEQRSGGPMMVLADRTALIRLLRIWLDNACKATPPGGSIAIRSELVEQRVVLAVEDTGIGIASNEQERIFERFYRVDHEDGSQRRGAGLGLSLAAWIAEQHKTRITLKSVPGQGARFEISLRKAGIPASGAWAFKSGAVQAEPIAKAVSRSLRS